MANSRELSQFGRLVEIKDGTHIGIGTQSDVAIGFGTITAIRVGDSNTVYYGDGSNLSGVSGGAGAASTAYINAETLNVSGFSTFQAGIFAIDQYLGFGNPGSFGHGELRIRKRTNTQGIIQNQTGDFIIDNQADSTSNYIRLQGRNTAIEGRYGNETIATFANGGAVELNYSGSKKFATTSTGVNVTGDMIATGSVGIGSTVVGVTTSTGSLIYVPDQGIQVWTGSKWRAIQSTSATTYSITQDQTSRNEGETVTFSVNTTGLSNGYELYWTTKTVSGTINSSDFSDNATQGTATVNSSGQATIARTLSNDQSTEGTESFTIEIRDGGYSTAVVAEGQTVTIADTSTSVSYATLVQGAYGSSSINGLSWSASTPNDGGGVSSLAIPTNRKTYIEIYWSSNGGGNPGAGVCAGQNTELGLAGPKGWWRGGSQNGMENNTWTFSAQTGSTGFSTGQYIGIGMDPDANSGNGQITFYRNGTAVFAGGSGWTGRNDLYFHWQNNGNGTSAGTFNFGATSFQYPLSGYSGLYS